eukprot:TRINITY_DN6351_c0_g1_i1.p1 TRINITY_DN6351_c0_g1~~TRINITY_DN6351_c0_g1_i1.p1  ORF type:complete len:131 (+),score=36.20 TRINITY_DN6351_c0_g1_i1:216-608(+)
MKPPAIPDALLPPMVEVKKPEAPKPEGEWKDEVKPKGSCKLPIELDGASLKGDKAGKSKKVDDACGCAFTCTRVDGAIAWTYKASKKKNKKGKMSVFVDLRQQKCVNDSKLASGLMGDENLLKQAKKDCN